MLPGKMTTINCKPRNFDFCSLKNLSRPASSVEEQVKQVSDDTGFTKFIPTALALLTNKSTNFL